MSRFFLLSVISTALVSLAGCTTIGTVLGAGVGGAAGKRAGGNSGAVVGAVVGGLIGNQIGRQLDAYDQRRLEEARRAAMVSNQPQRFYADSVKSEVVVQSKTYSKPGGSLVLANDLEVAPLSIVQPSEIAAGTDIPVYRSPSTSAPPKMVISQGAQVTSIAVVDGTQWVLVGRGDYGIGYVPAGYLSGQGAALPGSAGGVARAEPVRPPPAHSRATPARARPTTEELLTQQGPASAGGKEVPIAKTSSIQYQRSATEGEVKAAALKSGQRKDPDLKLTPAGIQCKDLTTWLLSGNSKDTQTRCAAERPST